MDRNIELTSKCCNYEAYELVQEGANLNWEFPIYICKKCNKDCRIIPTDKIAWSGEKWVRRIK